MKKIFLSIIILIIVLACKNSTNKCEENYLKAKQNYIDYGFDYDKNIAIISLKQINQSLECDDNLEEKLSIKLPLLLHLKRFEEARQLANEYGHLPKFSYFENKTVAVEYVNMIECFDKRDEECMKQKVEFIIKELEKKGKKDEVYYMTYYDLKSYVNDKETLKKEIEGKSNFSSDQKQLLSDFVEYNDNPLGPFAIDGPFAK